MRFLRTRRSPADLRTALAVVRELKGCENMDKWEASLSMWARPEQLENHLRLLTDAEVDQCKDQCQRRSKAEPLLVWGTGRKLGHFLGQAEVAVARGATPSIRLPLSR